MGGCGGCGKRRKQFKAKLGLVDGEKTPRRIRIEARDKRVKARAARIKARNEQNARLQEQGKNRGNS